MGRHLGPQNQQKTPLDLTIGAAHIRWHLRHHREGMAQLRLSTAELSEDLLEPKCISGGTSWHARVYTHGLYVWLTWMFLPTGWKPNQRFACFYVIHGVDGVGWGGVITFIGTSSHISCYATVFRLALPHIHDATLFVCRLALPHIYDANVVVCRLALPHIYDATLL